MAIKFGLTSHGCGQQPMEPVVLLPGELQTKHLYWRCQHCGFLSKRGVDDQMFMHRGKLTCINCFPVEELSCLCERARIMRLKCKFTMARSPKVKIIVVK